MLVVARGLWKRYGRRWALRDLNINVENVEIRGIVGPNGAGKSTLLKVLAGLLSPDRGEVRVFDEKPEEARELIGYAGESRGLRENSTVFGEMMSYCILRGCKRAEIFQKLSLFGLDDKVRQSVRALSQGMKQRLVLARSLLGEPKLVLWDEPFKGLDAHWKDKVLKIMDEFKRRGTTFILTFHDFYEALLVVDKITLIEDGKDIKTMKLNEIGGYLKVRALTLRGLVEEEVSRDKLGFVIDNLKNDVIKAEILPKW